MKDERNPFITLEEARARGLRHSEPEPVACTYCGRATVPLGIEYGGEVRWITHEPCVFVSSSGFQLRQRFFSHVARKGFRFGKGVPLSLFGFAS